MELSGGHFHIKEEEEEEEEELIIEEDEPEIFFKAEPCEKGSLFICDGLIDVKKEEELMIMDDSSGKNDSEFDQEHAETEMDPNSTNNDQIRESTKAQTKPKIHRRRTSPEGMEAEHSMNEALSTLNNVLLKQGNKHQQQDDECDMYGKMVAKKLRKLPYHERLRFMHEIDGMFIRRLSENMQVFVSEPPNTNTPQQVH